MIESGSTLGYAPPPTIVSLQTPIWPDSGTSKGELAKTEVALSYDRNMSRLTYILAMITTACVIGFAECAGRRCQTNQGDAIVGLSGPADFGTLSIVDNARSITMPALFVFSNTDRSTWNRYARTSSAC